MEEFKQLLRLADNQVKMLPATAQVAAQQGASVWMRERLILGKYLARLLNHRARNEPTAAFRYNHLGAFANIGGDAGAATTLYYLWLSFSSC